METSSSICDVRRSSSHENTRRVLGESTLLSSPHEIEHPPSSQHSNSRSACQPNPAPACDLARSSTQPHYLGCPCRRPVSTRLPCFSQWHWQPLICGSPECRSAITQSNAINSGVRIRVRRCVSRRTSSLSILTHVARLKCAQQHVVTAAQPAKTAVSPVSLRHSIRHPAIHTITVTITTTTIRLPTSTANIPPSPT